MAGDDADPIDLIDGVAARLEQARAIACSIVEQIEGAGIAAALSRQLSGEVGAMHTQILDVQALVETLAARYTRPYAGADLGGY